jgi:hypothetical protein
MQNDGLNPDVEIQIEIYDNPETYPYFNELVYPGARVGLAVDLTWIQLDDTFTVTSIECSCPNNRESTYTLTLNQPTSMT